MRFRWRAAGALLLWILAQAALGLVSLPRVAEGLEAPASVPRHLGETIRVGTVDSEIARERARQRGSDELTATFAGDAASRQEQRQRMARWMQAHVVETTPGIRPRAGTVVDRQAAGQ